MAEIQAVKDPEPDPKAGKPRSKSGVLFPYYNLDKSIEVAHTVHEKAGGVCDRAQLAALLNYSGVQNGGFLSRVAAAKMFGLIEQDGEKLRVTTRGQTIVAPVSPVDAERARAEAFLAVDLFKKVFDQYNGQALPAEVGLKNLLQQEYQVVPDRIGPTVRIMLESAEQAGFFKATGPGRMVMPLAASAAPQAPAAPQGQSSKTEGQRYGGGNGGGGGYDGGNIHPAILGLLRELPPAGTALNSKRRTALIDAFKATVGFIYPDVEVGEP